MNSVQSPASASLTQAGQTPLAPRSALRRTLPALVRANFGTARGLVRCVLAEAEFLLGRLEPFLRPDLLATRRLVFVCHGNINRSAFAQAVATSLGLRAISIGLSTKTGHPAYEKACDAARRVGLDLHGHRATSYVDYQHAVGDLFLVMEIRHARALLARGVPAAAIALLGDWARPHRIHLHDPHTLSDDYFRSCFALVHSAVVQLGDDLRRHGSPTVLP